jgi:hypothetical protein
MGAFSLFVSFGLALVKINRSELEMKSRSNPGLALFRFSAYRWGAVLVCFVFGLFSLFVGLGWVR